MTLSRKAPLYFSLDVTAAQVYTSQSSSAYRYRCIECEHLSILHSSIDSTKTMTYDCSFVDDLVTEGRVRSDSDTLAAYAEDEGPHDPHRPDRVVWPDSVEEIATVLTAANERGVPVTPWSGGTSIAGNPIPVDGGIVLTTYEFDAISVRQDDLQAVVGPGVVYDDLNATLAQHNLRFAPGIAAGDIATIGGMIANNASGLNAVRYGVTGDHVRRLEVVLPDGRVIECGRDVAKTTAGYNLKDLFVGSEGTLGVITEATLSLEGIAQHRHAALVTFPSSVAASQAVSTIMASGLKPGALEFMDTQMVELINDYTDAAEFPVGPLLLIELHGTSGDLSDQMSQIRAICNEHDAVHWSDADSEDIDTIWQVRRDAYPAACEYYEDRTVGVIGDVVVPISKYPHIVRRITTISDELEVLTPCVGHAGDGNIHFLPIVDTEQSTEMDRVHELNDRIVNASLELGGTATGEHGIGIGKRKFMRQEHGEAVDVMNGIKDMIDPNRIMNPEKTLPNE